MNTATLVRASADIVTIVSLRTGDVYQRIEKDYSGDYKSRYGVVQTVAHNGEDAFITAIEFDTSYGGVEPKVKTFGTDSDLKLFATTPEEVRAHFAKAREASRRSIETKEADLAKAKEADAMLRRIIRQQGQLTAPETVIPVEFASTGSDSEIGGAF